MIFLSEYSEMLLLISGSVSLGAHELRTVVYEVFKTFNDDNSIFMLIPKTQQSSETKV